MGEIGAATATPFHLILVIGDFPPREEIIGGEQVRPFELVKYWATMGRSGEVWCLRPAQRRRGQLGAVRVHSVVGKGVLREALILPVLIGALLRAAWRWKQGAARPVLVHRPGGVFYWRSLPILGDPSLALLWLCRLLGFVIVASVHDVSPEHEEGAANRRAVVGHDFDSVSERHRRGAGHWNCRMQRTGLRHSDLAIVTSFRHRQMLESRGAVPRHDYCLIPPGVEPATFQSIGPPMAPATRWRIGIPGSAFDSDLLALERALHLLPRSVKVELVVAGRDADAVGQLRFGPNICVRTESTLRYAEFPALARDVDLWVLVWGVDPYLQSTSPLRVPMCIASGRPVISTRLEEFGVAGFSGLLVECEPTPEGLADAIASVISDNRVFARSQRAAKIILRDFTWASRFGVLDRALLKLVEPDAE